MCGIGLLLLTEESSLLDHNKEWNDILSETLSSRGPDLPLQTCHCNIISNGRNVGLTLHSSVLHMRGETPSPQPLLFSVGPSLDEVASNGSKCALCWNGECYTYSEEDADHNESTNHRTMLELITKSNIDDSFDQSDTILVRNLLFRSIANARQNAALNASPNDLEHQAIASTMERIHGEYSFLLYVPSRLDQSTSQPHEIHSQGCVYFGRDVLGRRSLLINRSEPGVIIISSVAADFSKTEKQKDDNLSITDWEELPPGIVYKMDIPSGEVTSLALSKIVNTEVHNKLRCVVETGQRNMSDESISAAARVLHHLLDKSIQRRVVNAPTPKSQCESDASVALLFSGGIDSVILAALCHNHVPPCKSIDLINVSFYDDSNSDSCAISPDRLAALLSFVEMTTKWPRRHWRFIAVES